jgi:hypothetical protein
MKQLKISFRGSARVYSMELSTSPSGIFFAGNFWWARGNYLSTCQLDSNSRYSCEQFVGTGKQPIIKTFHQSGEHPLMALYTYEHFPQYFWSPPGNAFFQGIMNLYNFGYDDQYYRPGNCKSSRKRLKAAPGHHIAPKKKKGH